DRVDDGRRGVLGPGRAREVERLEPLERRPAPGVGLRALGLVDLPLRERLELPV
ncbi:MAG: hypothetical protein AVDCRST_MAG11-4068, partial [uncultured Gemmatimonadaceae bacterium]